MPSSSEKQARLMRAVANGWKKPGGKGPSKKVAKEFVAADKKRKKYRRSTRAKVNNPDTRHGKLDMPFKSLKRFAGMAAGGDVMKAKNGVRKMQTGGMTAPKTAPMPAPRTPTLPSKANARATTAMGNRGMMGRPTVPPAPSDMRNVPTLPSQASDRAKSIMAGRRPSVMPQPMPISSAPSLPQTMPISGAPSLSQPDYSSLKNETMYTPEAAPGNAMGSTLPSSGGYITGSARPTGFRKGGKIKRMAGGGGTNPRKGGALYNKGTNFNPKMRAGGKVPTAPSLPSQASSKAGAAMSRFAGAGKRPGMKKGGKVMKYAAGGAVSKRADGCCMKGRTKGKIC